MDTVPDSAAINEAVNLAGKRGFRNLKGFVNGVLRNISRNKDEIRWPSPKRGDINSEIQALSVLYSMPEKICSIFLEAYGYEECERILKDFLNPRPVIIRMDERMSESDMDKLSEAMKAESPDNFEIRKHELVPYAYELFHTDNIRYLPGYEEGCWMVQDVSSMLVAEAAGIKEGDTVIDVCSAPGGKAMHAAAKTGKSGRVIARDLTESKVNLINENIERMNLKDTVTAEVHDATVHDPALEEQGDVLLCDLPCSGLGIIGRKGDIKYSVTEEGLESLKKLQRTILENVWNYVKPGGIMMYSTCTVNPEENEEMVDYICENYPFERVSLCDILPDSLKKEPSIEKGYIQLLPGKYDTDGFFLAKLRRKTV
jgi:16S rRNA (cytosine967-C5)-methyltransferase